MSDIREISLGGVVAIGRVDPAPKKPAPVQFDFEIGDRVRIRESSIEADVVSLLHDKDGNRYEIVYWYSGCRYSGVWVFPREIVAVTPKSDAKP